MPTSLCPPYPTVLLLKADRFYAESLRRAVLDAFPDARVTVTHTVDAAWRAFGRARYDVVLTGIGRTLESDALEFLSLCLGNGPRALKTLVISAQLEERTLVALRCLGVSGVFDTTHEDPASFTPALQTVLDGQLYWSDRAVKRARAAAIGRQSPCRVLTAAEQLMLAVLGDGCDDEAGARLLGLSASTVATVRRELHRKLGVSHRGELIRVALLHGFIRFTPRGVIRPGLSLLRAACDAKRRRNPLPAKAA